MSCVSTNYERFFRTLAEICIFITASQQSTKIYSRCLNKFKGLNLKKPIILFIFKYLKSFPIKMKL